MQFTSFAFFAFFVVFFVLYWHVFKNKVAYQNLFLLLSSYFFYGWFNLYLAFYLLLISGVTYGLGQLILKKSRYATAAFIIGLAVNFAGLVYFRYLNHFSNTVYEISHLLGFVQTAGMEQLIVPVGLSFYTFRSVSYLIDGLKGKIKTKDSLLTVMTYISFFPTLLSGPIDKAGDFLNQLNKSRTFDYELAKLGIKQIIWGFFKKIAIADQLIQVTDTIFANHTELRSSTLVLGLFLYSIQVYSDFSGYSDIAIGIGKLIGFRVTSNFDYPFFAQTVPDFWRRWHISLTTWITEYVFTPLSISLRDWGNYGIMISIMATFILVGLWHGATETFILFGFIHGLFFIPSILKGKLFKKEKFSSKKGSVLQTGRKIVQTYLIVVSTFVLFKAESLEFAFSYYAHLFTTTIYRFPVYKGGSTVDNYLFILVGFTIVIEWFNRNEEFAVKSVLKKQPKFIRWTFFSLLVTAVLLLSKSNQSAFLYFQF